jgi:hypothetical protein
MAMALTLSKSSANTQMLLAHVSTSTGVLDATSRKMLSASLTLLSSTLKTAVDQSVVAVGAFEALESQATQLQATLQGAALHFKAEQDDASTTMQQAQNDVREQAYTASHAPKSVSRRPARARAARHASPPRS